MGGWYTIAVEEPDLDYSFSRRFGGLEGMDCSTSKRAMKASMLALSPVRYCGVDEDERPGIMFTRAAMFVNIVVVCYSQYKRPYHELLSCSGMMSSALPASARSIHI